MYPGLPRAFPNVEWNSVEDIFHPKFNDLPIGPTVADPAETWVRQELAYYEESYTSIQELYVSVTTFNVGCKKPIIPLTSIVGLRSGPDGATPTDLIVVGLQEIDMGATAMFKQETEAATPWVTALNAAIDADSIGSIGSCNDASSSPSLASYYAFPPKQLVGLLLCVFIRRPLLSFVSEFSIATVATGALGSMGNKGAVGARLVLHRTSFCIMTAHLAAGQANVAKRNDDINTILKGMDFNATRRSEMQLNANANVVPEILYPEVFPRDHDFVIVAGDLNYRVTLPYETAVHLANLKKIKELLQYDQLTVELSNPHTPWQNFIGFTPTHQPTYRFDIGTDTYDTSEKHRIPSFTDRICLWSRRRSMAQRVCLDALTALTEVRSSDHKPVQALLRLPMCVEVPEQKEQVLTSLRDRVKAMGLAKASNAKMTLSTAVLDFGAQSFHHCGVNETVMVTNNGDCVAVVRVARQQQGDNSEGTWLRVTPQEFAVLPGESQAVVVETAIDPRCMTYLASWRPYQGHGRIGLDSFLMFCCRNGPVQLLECKCVLSPSIFGNGLDNITLLQQVPCREAYQRKEDFAEVARVVRPQVPKELWYMADVIARSPYEPGLFTKSTDKEKCSAIMLLLDTTNEPLPRDVDVHCVAECLLAFLKSLQEPVVPFSLYAAALAAGRARGKAPIAFLRQLPTAHANVWIYITSLLCFLLRPSFTTTNELDAALLAHLFSSVLIIRPAKSQGLSNARLLHGGGVDQQVRQQLQQEVDDAVLLVEYFLTTPPAVLSNTE